MLSLVAYLKVEVYWLYQYMVLICCFNYLTCPFFLCIHHSSRMCFLNEEMKLVLAMQMFSCWGNLQMFSLFVKFFFNSFKSWEPLTLFFFQCRLVKLLMGQTMAWSVLFLMEVNTIMVRILCLSQLVVWLPFLVYTFIYIYSCSLVFDVDIGDGEPMRKLPYNRSGIIPFYPGLHYEFILFVFFSSYLWIVCHWYSCHLL